MPDINPRAQQHSEIRQAIRDVYSDFDSACGQHLFRLRFLTGEDGEIVGRFGVAEG